MTYLSRLQLDPRDRAVRRDMADCEQLHRTVLSCFPQVTGATKAREEFGVLHRLDVEGTRVVLLVQASEEPQWNLLPSGYLSMTPNNPACKQVDEAYAVLSTGSQLRFRLRANPTKRLRVTHPDSRLGAGKRVDIRGEDKQIEWLARKGERGGFKLSCVQAAPDVENVRTLPGQVVGDRHGGRSWKSPRLIFGSVVFDGMLTITDAEAFRTTLRSGIGSGKAYGFGLLSVAPAES